MALDVNAQWRRVLEGIRILVDDVAEEDLANKLNRTERETLIIELGHDINVIGEHFDRGGAAPRGKAAREIKVIG